MDKVKALTKINELITTGEQIIEALRHANSRSCRGCEKCESAVKNFDNWKQEINLFLGSNPKFQLSYAEFTKIIRTNSRIPIAKRYVPILQSLKKSIEDDTIELECSPQEKRVVSKSSNEQYIFIGHGHSPLWSEIVRFLNDDLCFQNNIYFEKESRVGQHIGEILKGFADKATFAIILMTADDETKEDKIRARQNVIHEIGFFQGKLGFEKVAILKQEGVEPFSNNDGFQYILFSGNNISQTFFELQKVLKRENVIG